jgi:hypothetical protein
MRSDLIAPTKRDEPVKATLAMLDKTAGISASEDPQ